VKHQKLSQQFIEFFKLATRLVEIAEADAVLVYVESVTEWEKIAELAAGQKTIIAADSEEMLAGLDEYLLHGVVVELGESPILEKLMHALVGNGEAKEHAQHVTDREEQAEAHPERDDRDTSCIGHDLSPFLDRLLLLAPEGGV
jgi:hypothetical protein